ncbi:hypothetical protein [Chondrinema litorale]|uniref:hypothetical protein n=1 Tax=Chondrinema litorale TaxID=2994555 RepID=UPI002542F154|nr:hypothetical protein [Chondrinema litorale]UZR95357.1 hypothetical protein OQ292_05930 [Chondrinema litorale]
MAMIFLVIAIALAIGGSVGSMVYIAGNKQKQIDNKIPNRQVVEMAEKNSGKITVSQLSSMINISSGDARAKLYSMLSSGIFEYGMNDKLQEEFVLCKNVRDALKNNTDINTTAYQNPKSKEINDSQVIKLAAKSNGRLTTASLSMKSGISVDKSQEILNNLQDKGIFDIQVTNNGAIVYQLIDTDLIES